MSRAEVGIEQLEAAIHNFPNLMPDTIDLTAFMSEETIHRVKDAKQYRQKLFEMLAAKDNYGQKTPWRKADFFRFREGEMTVWAGFKGHGKSLLLSQVVLDFMTNDASKVFVISPEFQPHQVLHRMIWQAMQRHYTLQEMDEWLNILQRLIWLYDLQGSLKPADVPALCRYAAEKLGVKHILIDSLMKCGIPPDDYQGQKKLVDAVQQVAHKTGCHTHLVAHARKGKDDHTAAGIHDIKGTSEIGDMAENVVVVWRNKPKEQQKDNAEKSQEPDAIFKVESQRNGSGEIGMVPLIYDKHSMTYSEMSQ